MATATTINDYVKGYDKNTKDIDTLNSRISSIVANNGNGTKDSEIVDARKGKASLRDRIDEVENKIALNNDEISKETKDARVDFDGGIHKNLNLRLLEDFNNLYKLIYNSTLLEYEGQYITANNSYKGIAENMQLKGRTLQNLLKSTRNDILVQYGAVATWQLYKPGTVYTIVVTNRGTEIKQLYLNEYCFVVPTEFTIQVAQTSIIKATTLSNFTGAQSTIEVLLKNKITHTQANNLEVIVLEGDYTNKPIPSYFEGIRSVGETGENLEVISCGKNLFNGWLRGRIDSNTGKITYSDMQTFNIVTKYINVKKLTKYITSISDQFYSFVAFYDADKKYISRTSGNPVSKLAFETPTNCRYVVLTQYNADISFNEELMNSIKPQLEEGTIATFYESYKEHRQVITLKEPLRGINDSVSDVVDFNKFKLIRNVGSKTFKGDSSESWSVNLSNVNETTALFNININDKIIGYPGIICDKFTNSAIVSVDVKYEGIYERSVDVPTIYIRILKSRMIGWSDTLTFTEKGNMFKSWLQSNPVTVYYQLATPIETPIDLVPPRTYDGITNIFMEGSLIESNLKGKISTDVNSVIKTLQAVNARLTMVIQQNKLNTIQLSVEQDARLTALELGVI